ncbi:plant intracellular Ras-group-related LRR protein 5-like [Curcuma longa]|uniref:plant intracellular Ras-group-related LRR protein 5-like n=1 Tax=Curcuma longa TaxID=136217 RepID=UPI003D9EB5A3
MANPSVLEAVEEIMRIYRSLPPRPSIEEVEAAVAVIKSADAEEEARMREIGRIQKPPDVPDELFLVLQEARKNQVLLQGREQRRDAMAVVDLDRRFQVFDELVQRASKVVSPEDGGERGAEEVGFKVGFDVPVPRFGRSLSLIGKEKDGKLGDSDFSNGPAYPFKSELPSATGDPSKLSLIQVASIIESSAKKGIGVIDLQGKLLDQIEWLPVSLGKLQEVTELNLSENRIITLPPSVGSLKALTKLDVHSNQLSSLPDSFAELSNLVDLDLHANRLKSLPTSIGNLMNLANLDVSSNELSSLPDTLGNLTNLQRLNVETNNLEELPYTIGSCTALVELRADFNQLKALPEAVGKLENLEVLTLHYNRVKSLPTTMASLTKLKELDVSFNELESIPESLCFATSLVKLDVGRNFADLRALPRSIGNLEMLEELDISSNQIRVLPDSFRLLSKLRVFNADETPLEIPPRHVVKLGAQAVVQYMSDLVEGRTKSIQQTEPVRRRRSSLCFCLCSLFQSRKKSGKESTAS